MRRYLVWSTLCCVMCGSIACGDDDNAESNNKEMMQENQKPVARIDAPGMGLVDGQISASASQSTDPEGDTLSYTWTLDVPATSLSTLSSVSGEAVTFTPDAVGEYTLTLVASDGELESDIVSKVITVASVVEGNQAPVANAGPDRTVVLGERVGLNGGASGDPDGDDLTFAWSITMDAGNGAEQMLSGEDEVNFSFTPAMAGDYVITLTVNDGKESASDTVTITVSEDGPINQAPAANAGSDVSVDVNAEVTLDAGASTDPEGDVLTYSWAITTDPSAGVDVLTDADTAMPTFTPSVAGEYVLTVTVTDPSGADSSDDVTVTVMGITPQNSLPVAAAGAAQTVSPGDVVMLDASASTDIEDDAAGTALTYSWAITTDPSAGVDMLMDADTAMPNFTPSVIGEYVLTLTVTDSEGGMDTAEVTVTVQIAPVNQAPVADAGAAQTVAVGSVVMLDGSASTDLEDDAAGTALTYSWAITTDPSAGVDVLTDADTATPSITPGVEGDYVLTLTVTDSAGEMSTATVQITVQLVVVNQPPVAVAGDARYLVFGGTSTLDGSASTDIEDDAAGTALTYSWAITTDPSAGVDVLTGADTATPSITPGTRGTYTFTLTVTDSMSAMSTSSVTLDVFDAPNLILGERIEGSANNKALEVFNPAATPQDLAPIHVATLNGGSLTSPSGHDAQGSLAANGVYVLCHTGRDNAVITVACDGQDSAALNYNGDDVTVVYVEQDGVAGFDAAGDHVLDAWGEIGVALATRPYAEKGYSRCDFQPFDGTGGFVFSAFYTENPVQDDFSDLGTPPVAGCGVVLNVPPVSSAGSDQLVLVGELVTLDGSTSTDIEDDAAGTALNYAWTITADPSAGVDVLMNADTAMPSITLSVSGTYEFTLTVTDSSGDMDSDTIEVVVRSPMMGTVPALFISEIVEGSSLNKAVEIFNGSDMDIDLTDVHIVTMSNGAQTSTGQINLMGTLAAGAVTTICHPSTVLSPVCDLTSASVANFNGDDTTVLYLEDGTSLGFNPAEDTPIDVFGQIGVRPASTPYADAGYERCDFTLFDGLAAFTAGRYIEESTRDIFSGIGVAPARDASGFPISTCPGSLP